MLHFRAIKRHLSRISRDLKQRNAKILGPASPGAPLFYIYNNSICNLVPQHKSLNNSGKPFVSRSANWFDELI
jgi:hypothetical protein